MSKIIFLVTSKGHGKGGHFYSLLATIAALSADMECYVINIGNLPSPVLTEAQLSNYFYINSGLSVSDLQKKINSKIIKINPEFIHAFDVESLFFAKTAGRLLSKKVVHTKCGGPNPKRFYPHSDTLVLYSKENFNYFSANRKHKLCKKFLIPNRTFPPVQNHEKLVKLKTRYCIEGFVFLRIARISKFHENSIMKSINLVNELQRRGLKCGILIVGAVQDGDVQARIVSALGEQSYLETSDEYTVNASAIIGFADAVVGTGRSAMEAASAGKLLFSPVSNLSVPVLVDATTADSLLEYNFSDRSRLLGVSEKDAVSKAASLIESQIFRTEAEDFLKAYSLTHFDIKSKISELRGVYSSAKIPRFGLVEHVIHRIIVYRNLFSKKARGGA